jgi:hypothetical protein
MSNSKAAAQHIQVEAMLLRRSLLRHRRCCSIAVGHIATFHGTVHHSTHAASPFQVFQVSAGRAA